MELDQTPRIQIKITNLTEKVQMFKKFQQKT